MSRGYKLYCLFKTLLVILIMLFVAIPLGAVTLILHGVLVLPLSWLSRKLPNGAPWIEISDLYPNRLNVGKLILAIVHSFIFLLIGLIRLFIMYPLWGIILIIGFVVTWLSADEMEALLFLESVIDACND